ESGRGERTRPRRTYLMHGGDMTLAQEGNASRCNRTARIEHHLRMTSGAEDGRTALDTRRLRGAIAELLEDIWGAAVDVQKAGETVGEPLKLWAPESPQPDGPIPSALWAAALISYARVFTSGVRKPMAGSLIDGLGDGARDAHEYYLTIRDKHIAHSVGYL